MARAPESRKHRCNCHCRCFAPSPHYIGPIGRFTVQKGGRAGFAGGTAVETLHLSKSGLRSESLVVGSFVGRR